MAHHISRKNLLRWTPPSLGFIAGYGIYHIQTREETFGQQIPLDAVRVYSSIAPWFRFLRRESDLTPEVKEILRCARIQKFASDFGISSDSLHKRLLRMEANIETHEGGVERVRSILDCVKYWSSDILLLACEAVYSLPLDPDVPALHRMLVATAKTLEKDSAKAALWTVKVYGKDANIPAEQLYVEKAEVNRLLRLISQKQHPYVPWDFGTLGDRIRWKYALPISALGIAIILGQDGLGIGQYRAYDLVTVVQRGGNCVTETGGRGLEAMKRCVPTSMPHIRIPSVRISDWAANLRMPLTLDGTTDLFKQQILHCRTVVHQYTSIAFREADRFMEHVRAHFGQSPLPPTPPHLSAD